MPELPEVEVVCRGLEPLLQGKILNVSHSFRQDLRYPLPDFSVLHGAKLEKIMRRSKYILIYFVCRDAQIRILCWHLGMTGQFHVLSSDTQAGKHEHVRFDFSEACSYVTLMPDALVMRIFLQKRRGWHPSGTKYWLLNLYPMNSQASICMNYVHREKLRLKL